MFPGIRIKQLGRYQSMNQLAAVAQIGLSSLFSPKEIFLEKSRVDEEGVIQKLIELIGESGWLEDIEKAFSIIIDRKCCSLSYLHPEIAVFHARVPGLKSLRLALAINPGGIECCWTTGENAMVKLIFLVLTTLEEPGEYMRTVTALTRACRKKDFPAKLYAMDDPEKIWAYFDKLDIALPEYVTAGDIMQTTFHSLRDTDSLREAIDAFCRYGTNELPILDVDGDLVGVVSEDELIRICLPEYITWMEDLSPILDFQPFAEILLREREMPVVEIRLLADRYATVDEATPAIQVARVMMRRDVRQVLVVRGNKLMGVISVQDFIQKILRA